MRGGLPVGRERCIDLVQTAGEELFFALLPSALRRIRAGIRVSEARQASKSCSVATHTCTVHTM